MRIAVYSRKSKWTGKGESVENQLIMCREYILNNIDGAKVENIEEYEDEGFSGKDTDRPQFQIMMKNMNKHHYDYLVCYKLDRLGRNLSDLVNLIEKLNKRETSFISIKEKFDTSTPIGRAMMFFSGVLAQMEREQIAERVRDNMLMLARAGRWLGGNTPLGFYSIEEEIISNNKKRSFHKLVKSEDEIKMANFIYEHFLENQSLSKLVTYFYQRDIKTKNRNSYQIMSIRAILTNPVYCAADENAINYFKQLGCVVCIEDHEVDSTKGLMSYNKTTSSKYRNQPNPHSEWIIAIGKHESIISGEQWIKVQEILEINKKKGDNYRKVQNPVSVLSGVLYCKCGSFMRPKNYPAHRVDKKGNRTFAYLCSNKEKSKGTKCSVCNVHGNTLDDLVCEEVLNYINPESSVYKGLEKIKAGLKKSRNTSNSEVMILEKNLKEKNDMIKKLISSLGKSANEEEAFFNYIREEINKLDNECKQIKNQVSILNEEENVKEYDEIQLQLIESQLKSFSTVFENLSVLEKREYLRVILEKVVWDGENAHIFMYGEHEES